MPTNYPLGRDEFIEPTQPQNIPLSQAGSGNYNHVESHTNMGDAIEALQNYAALRYHDHSGPASDPAKGGKLKQANTHEDNDKDASLTALHHSLSTSLPTSGTTDQFKAAAGNHTHSYATLLNRPYVICTSTSRPDGSPDGTTIFETDTNRMRIRYNNRWAISHGAEVPTVLLSQATNQSIAPGGTTLTWGVEENNFGYPVTGGAITVTEPGLYHVSVGMQWGVNFLPEIATVVVCRDGAETAIRNSSLQTRSGLLQNLLSLIGSPGAQYSQTIAVSGTVRVSAGQQISVKASYGGATPIGTAITSFFQSQVKSRLELHYVGP